MLEKVIQVEATEVGVTSTVCPPNTAAQACDADMAFPRQSGASKHTDTPVSASTQASNSPEGRNIKIPPWVLGPMSLHGGPLKSRKEAAVDHSDPACGLACRPQGAASKGNDSLPLTVHLSPEPHPETPAWEAREAIARLHSLQRFLVNNDEEENVMETTHGSVSGLNHSAYTSFDHSMADDYWDAVIDDEYDEIEGSANDSLSGCCLGCGVEKPTLMVLAKGDGCRHVVYCDRCAAQHIRQTQEGRRTSVPAHLWTESASNIVRCPICRAEGRLVRIWLPGEAGGRNGLCLRCQATEASVMFAECRHLAYCQECMSELRGDATDDEQCEIACPACGTLGQAYRVFLP